MHSSTTSAHNKSTWPRFTQKSKIVIEIDYTFCYHWKWKIQSSGIWGRSWTKTHYQKIMNRQQNISYIENQFEFLIISNFYSEMWVRLLFCGSACQRGFFQSIQIRPSPIFFESMGPKKSFSAQKRIKKSYSWEYF